MNSTMDSGPIAIPVEKRLVPDWINWSFARWVTRSRLPQIAGLIPIAGYALLWSGEIGSLLSSFPNLGSLLFTPTQRLVLINVGGWFAFIGVVVYFARCPQEIRDYGSPEDYARATVAMGEAGTLERAGIAVHKRIRQQVDFSDKAGKPALGLFLGLYPLQQLGPVVGQAVRKELGGVGQIISAEGPWAPGIGALLSAYYTLRTRVRPGAAFLCLIAYLVAALAFLAPAFEVSAMVLLALPRLWLGM